MRLAPAAVRWLLPAKGRTRSDPVLAGSLLAIYPLVQHFKACTCLSASRDGLTWSRPQPLTRCGVAGERATTHPAAGLIARGDAVDLYMHEQVPAIGIDTRTPADLRDFLEAHGREARLVRYRVPAAALREWTREALATL